MRVELWAEHRDGCGFYRLEAPGTVLRKAGYDVETRYEHINFQTIKLRDPSRPEAYDRIHDIIGKPDADVVVYQRPMFEYKLDLIRILQRKGIAVVVELDDDFHNIDEDSKAFKHAHPHWHLLDKSGLLSRQAGVPTWGWNPKRTAYMNYNNIMAACEVADLVTVTTPALAELYGKHGRVAVLPNFVPDSYLAIATCRWGHSQDIDFCMACGWEPTDGQPAILAGWTGSVDTHPHDLEETGGGVAQALAATPNSGFFTIGTGKGVQQRLGLNQPPLTTEGWVSIGDYPHHVAKLDVGIVPLADTAFNAAKSCLKGMEMAATGVPFVASPRADYQRLARLGVGELADSPKDWRKKVARLLRDPIHRQERSETYRNNMKPLTYENNADLWWSAWQLAAEYRAVREAA